MMWRWVPSLAGLSLAGSTVVLAACGDWAAVGTAAAAVLLLGAVLAGPGIREAWADAREELRAAAEPEPVPELVPAPRLERVSRPPWETAPMPVRPSPEPVETGRHRAERGLRDVLADALRAAREAYLP